MMNRHLVLQVSVMGEAEETSIRNEFEDADETKRPEICNITQAPIPIKIEFQHAHSRAKSK